MRLWAYSDGDCTWGRGGATVTTELIIHLESEPETGEVVWWAESPEVPGLSAAASSLRELREMAMYSLRQLGAAGPVVERLAGVEEARDEVADDWSVTVARAEPIGV